MASTTLTLALERDARIIQALVLVRGSLQRLHGVEARRLGAGDAFIVNNQLEQLALDAALRALGFDPREDISQA